MVSSAERLAGWRRRERAPAREPVRAAGTGAAAVTSSWSSRRAVTVGSSPVAAGSASSGTGCSAGPACPAGSSDGPVAVPSVFHCVAS